MEITAPAGTSAITHDGVEYAANDAGRFDVDHETGTALLRMPGFELWTGVSTEPDETVEQKCQRLEGELAEVNSRLAGVTSAIAGVRAAIDAHDGPAMLTALTELGLAVPDPSAPAADDADGADDGEDENEDQGGDDPDETADQPGDETGTDAAGDDGAKDGDDADDEAEQVSHDTDGSPAGGTYADGTAAEE